MRRAALAAAFVLAGCGGDDTKPAARATPAITPFPSIDRAELTPGTTYTTRAFQPAITLTLPDGEWLAASADKPDHVEIEPVVEDPVDNAVLAFHHVTEVFDPAEGGEAPGDAVPGPDDFAAWLTSHPHLEATEPEPVEALGLEGVSVDIRVTSSQPKQYRDCGKVSGKHCVVLMTGGIEPIVYGSDAAGRFLILEQPDGKQLVVEQFVEPRSAFDTQAKVFEEALASVTVAG